MCFLCQAADRATETHPSSSRSGAGSLDEMARYLTDGYWEDNGGSRARFFDSTIRVDITDLEADGRQLARWAFEAWELVADIDFMEVGRNADIVFDDSKPGAIGGITSYDPSTGEAIEASVNISTNWLNVYGTGIDSYSFSTYIHELGHALGLGHLGNYNGDAVYGRDERFANDSWQVSVMSYFDQEDNTTTDATEGELITAMMADIVAIQELYGAPDGSSPTSGNTVWGANSTLGGYLGHWFGVLDGTRSARGLLTEDDEVALTIYDRDGTDTIDLSFSDTGDRVRLSDYSFSDVAGGIGNLAIARGTVIENLVTGDGADTITANNENNVIRSGRGNDEISGWAGNDYLAGQDGSDRILGGSGRDTLAGGSGNDTLKGQGNADRIFGGSGNDNIDGGYGDDLLGGGSGNDTLEGGGGSDRIFGAVGHDVMSGGDGDDMLGGFSGNDNLRGGGGDDALWGAGDDDTLSGGSGNDTLGGFWGDDSLSGGSGRDELWGAAGTDTLSGGSDADSLGGGDGADLLSGDLGNDQLSGGRGNDTIYGGSGNDTIYAAGGNDRIDGGTGNDKIYGGSGADTFVFWDGDGADDVFGFSLGEGDTLRLDKGLWSGTFTQGQIVSEFAEMSGGNVTFDFGDTSFDLFGVGSLNGLAGAIDIF